MDLLIWPNSDTFSAIIAVLCIINSAFDVWQWYLALIESFIVHRSVHVSKIFIELDSCVWYHFEDIQSNEMILSRFSEVNIKGEVLRLTVRKVLFVRPLKLNLK